MNGVKLELLFKPHIQHVTIGKNFPPEFVSKYDSTKKDPGAVIEALSSQFYAAARHFHYGFYFRLPLDCLTEILAYTKLVASRDQYDRDLDHGILSGNVSDYWAAMAVFCKQEQAIELRVLFNFVNRFLEADGITCPMPKIDLGDQTYAVRTFP